MMQGQPRVLDVCAEDFARFQQGAEEILSQLQQEHTAQIPSESYTKTLVKRSADVAAEFGQRQIASEHMLVALVADSGAQHIFKQLKVDPADVQGYITVNALRDTTHPDHVEISQDVKSIIEQAHVAADADGATQPGPLHLLSALTNDPGMAGSLLRRFGITPEHIKEVSKEIEEESPKPTTNTPTLNQYSRDLTALARNKQLDPLIGRENEVASAVEILSRRRKNNPILVGEPGVGKTAIVEGLATKMVQKDAPKHLRGKRLLELSLNSVLAGARYRGEFEERLQKVVEEITQNKDDLIIFIDEVHTVVGAGSNEGSLDAATIMKPALARGDLHMIGATTLDEYQKYIEKDSALERRFQAVTVREPTVIEAEAIIEGVRPHYEQHHNVLFADDAISAAVTLSDRYVTNRFLPDKALDLLDQAAAKKRIAAAEKEQPTVTSADIAALLAQLTGIPVTQLSDDDKKRLLNLEERLHARVVGQDAAIKATSNAIRVSYAGLNERNHPIATMFFMGPTGVGKTELAKALTAELFGNETALIRIDMSEYRERHSVARLIGSPPGYVGYEEGGQLTEAVRRTPHSVILLDEIEKAHPEVTNIFLQIFDDGRLTDGKGRVVDFSNTIIIATSNIGGGHAAAKIGFSAGPMAEEENQGTLQQLQQHFRPEFINRLDEIVVFHPLTPAQVEEIVSLELAKVATRGKEQGILLKFTPALVKHLAQVGFSDTFGARELRRQIKQAVEQQVARAVLEGVAKPDKSLTFAVKDGTVYFKS